MQRTKNIVITGMLIALGIVLPMAFHQIPKAGQIFLPMHLPVMLCGFICGPILGLLSGILTPLISSFATGMPPVMPTLPAMLCELAVYGFVSGLLIRLIRTKSRVANIYIVLIVSMLLGRAVSGFMFGVILTPDKYGIAAWTTASFVMAWPGIIIQLIAVPALLLVLERARLINISPYDLWGLGFKGVKNSKQFFNSVAEEWDSRNNISGERLRELMNYCGVQNGDRVLDIACGTGIIDQILLERGADSVVGIDIADRMIEIARTKTDDDRLEYIADDFYSFRGGQFDRAIIFNAFPHFTDRQEFARKVSQCLKTGGSFYVLHSESAEVINSRHGGGAKKVTKSLNSASEEMAAFEPYFTITELIDSDSMYLISGIKK